MLPNNLDVFSVDNIRKTSPYCIVVDPNNMSLTPDKLLQFNFPSRMMEIMDFRISYINVNFGYFKHNDIELSKLIRELVDEFGYKYLSEHLFMDNQLINMYNELLDFDWVIYGNDSSSVYDIF